MSISTKTMQIKLTNTKLVSNVQYKWFQTEFSFGDFCHPGAALMGD